MRELSEEICAFTNGTGGFVLIGIEDDGKIIGCDISNSKRSAIQNSIKEISPPISCNFYSTSVGLFTRMQLVEKVGSGIPRMKELMVENGLKEPLISFDNDFFSITFYKAKNTKENTKENVIY